MIGERNTALCIEVERSFRFVFKVWKKRVFRAAKVFFSFFFVSLVNCFVSLTNQASLTQSDSGGINSIMHQEFFIKLVHFATGTNFDLNSFVWKLTIFQNAIEIWMKNDGGIDTQKPCSNFE